MTTDLTATINRIALKAPAGWIASACSVLRSLPASFVAESVITSLPATHNGDLAYLVADAVRQASNRMSWEALSYVLETTYHLQQRWSEEQRVELLWSGPSPAGEIPARRIDQALYDLIASAKREILLVTFAAAKIGRLTDALQKAVQRGVQVRLILEFEETSEGQLSYDALRAFPQALVSAVGVFYWPLERRERNLAGRPGKLHAKVAIVDDTVLVSSANLTDDAFNRNLEVGIMVRNPNFLSSIKGYLDEMIAEGALVLVSEQ